MTEEDVRGTTVNKEKKSKKKNEVKHDHKKPKKTI
jgi:hypothetical protein